MLDGDAPVDSDGVGELDAVRDGVVVAAAVVDDVGDVPNDGVGEAVGGPTHDFSVTAPAVPLAPDTADAPVAA